MVTYSKFVHDYINSFTYNEPVSQDYEVFVNGEQVPVYTARISKIPFNRPWPGHQREINQTELVSFVNLISDEKVNIEVVVKKEYQRINIRPLSKNIEYTDNGGRVSFALDEGQYVFNTDSLHGCLYIFNSKPIECPQPEAVTYYFGPGVHMAGKITLKDNESVYVDKDALVFGYVYAENAKNIRVFGNGLFDDICEERFYKHCYENFTNGNLKFYDCQNVKVEGVLFRNSAVWCTNFFHCFDVSVDNVKVFGQWRYNSDGMDIVNSQNVTVRNCFIHSFDDAVCVKGIDRYIDTNNENILIENCVLWCDWGKCCELGLETACRECKNITFRNCDIIRPGNTALDIQNGDCSEISNVLFENINIEYNAFDNVPMLQKNDESVYDAYDQKYIPRLFAFENNRFRNHDYCSDTWGIPKEHAPVDLTGINQTCVHDVTARNINIYYDDRIERENGDYNIYGAVGSILDDVEFYNIRVSNVRVNGVPLKREDVKLRVNKIRDFIFE